jgi:hypothetical protein
VFKPQDVTFLFATGESRGEIAVPSLRVPPSISDIDKMAIQMLMNERNDKDYCTVVI